MSLNILVIDDDAIDRMSVKRAMQKLNKDVIVYEAEQGKDGLAMMQERTFDCVFLDYLLPDMDGVRMLQEIQDDESKLLPCPIVMLTGQGNEKVMMEALGYGAQDYLLKDNISQDTLHIALTKAKQIYDLRNNQYKATKNLEKEVELRTKEYQEQSKLLYTIIENLPLTIFAKDVKDDYRWIILNAEAENKLGWDRNKLLGNTDYDYFFKEQADYSRKSDEAVMIGKTTIELPEEAITTPKGDFIANILKVPIYDEDGDPSMLLGILTDITANKLFLEELQRTKEEAEIVSQITESTSNPVIRLSSEGNVIYLNPSTNQVFPTLLQEGLEHKILHGVNRLFEQLKSGTPINQTDEVEWINDTSYIRTVVSIYTENSQSLAIYLQDITEVKKAQKLAERANRAKDDFLANMSHELRTPMNSILGLTKILLDDEELSNEQRDIFHIIDKSSASLLEIVNDILDLSKIEAGRIELEKRPFNLTNMMHSLIEQTKPLANQKGLIFKNNVDDFPSVNIIGDEFRLSRVIVNLISNAIKFTHEGLISIEVGFHERTDNTIDFVCSIKDTGIGIPEDMIESAFNKFTQAEESTARRFGGTGLGLNITKQIIELMGGQIKVESRINHGSIFTIRVACTLAKEVDISTAKKQLTALPSLPNNARIPIEDATVLIAEDHEFNQILIVKLLKRIGCKHYVLVKDGKSAVDEYKAEKYDIVLMDCHMPEMNGYDATIAIRAEEKLTVNHQHIPIMAMTSDAMAGTREKCLSAGMDEYISKPIDEPTFRLLMQTWFVLAPPKDKKQNGSSRSTPIINPPVNLSLLKEYADNDPEAEKQLIAVFYDKSTADIRLLSKNTSVANKVVWSETAHSLKGSVAYIGATHLQKMCERAQRFDSESTKDRQNILKTIKLEHDKICNYLKELGLLDPD